MTAVCSIQPLGLKVLAELVQDNRAIRPFFDKAARLLVESGHRLRPHKRDRRTRVLAINRRNALAETRELFLYIKHQGRPILFRRFFASIRWC